MDLTGDVQQRTSTDSRGCGLAIIAFVATWVMFGLGLLLGWIIWG